MYKIVWFLIFKSRDMIIQCFNLQPFCALITHDYGIASVQSTFVFVKFIALCGPVVRLSGYRSRSPVFDSRRFQIFREAAGVERGPLTLVKKTEELLERKSSGMGIRCADHATPSIRKRWH
jgi:hypothetical protein